MLIAEIVEVERFEQQASEHVQRLADDLALYLEGESIHARSLNMLDYIGRTLERSQFDVVADERLVFSKEREGRFPESAEILAALAETS